MIGNKVLLLTNVFHKILFLKPLITLITKRHGLTLSMLDLLPIHGFSIGEKKPKHLFQTGFKNGDSFLELFKTFSVLKLENILMISKQIVKVFSLWEIVIHYPFALNLESLGFFVGNLPPIISCLHHSPGIWLGNSKSNGG